MGQKIRKIIREQVGILYESEKISKEIENKYKMLFEFFGRKKNNSNNITQDDINTILTYKEQIENGEGNYKEITGTAYNNTEIRERLANIIKHLPQIKKAYAELYSNLKLQGIDIQSFFLHRQTYF